jgi:ribosomal protein S18 acetylase RimI-like enzyme
MTTNLSDIIIRVATTADLPKLKEIIDLSFSRFYRYFAWHSASNPDALVLVAEVEGKVAGFTKLTEFNIGTAKYGCILWIAVDPSHRHIGVALSLTETSVDCLRNRGSSTVFASTQRRNNGALATLGKAGFRQLNFMGLWHLFGWGVFGFYGDIWFAPGEIVLVRMLQ